nr:MAG TPA: hypothetical protein [Caudoviricetes sp.]
MTSNCFLFSLSDIILPFNILIILLDFKTPFMLHFKYKV